MKALRYKDQQLDVADVPRPEVNGEALVRVTLSGICNTDLEIARGYAGFEGTLGHEFVGAIESRPAEAALIAGQRGVGELNAGCGTCALCRADDSRHRPQANVLAILGRDGSHAGSLKLPLIH